MALSSGGCGRAGDVAALEAVFGTESDVVRNKGLEAENFLYTKAVEGGSNDVRGKTEV